MLRSYRWKGNLRELRNAVRRMVLLATNTELDEKDVQILEVGQQSQNLRSQSTSTGSNESLAQRLQGANDRLEAEILSQTIKTCRGNKAAAARALRIDYTTLHRKLKRHGLT